MREILTVSIGSKLKKKLNTAARKYKTTKSDIVTNAIEKYIASIEFEGVREKLMPYARKKGYLTDEDIYDDKGIK
ncbi:MAG: CopG family transcriptional regulator [Ignavibacteria bacterium]|nr:CopG family transcriptional regulator [Ignavibacteriota bacterium]